MPPLQHRISTSHMIASLLAVALITLVLFAGAAPAPAQDATPVPPGVLDGGTTVPAPVPQVALTAAMVEKFVKSWPDLQALGDEFAETYGVDDDVTDPITAFAAWSRTAAAKARIDAVLAKHGFADLDEWSTIANSVMLAYTYDPEQLSEANLAAAIAEIKGDAGIPDDQKSAIVEAMRAQFAAARDMVPPPGNVEAVKPFMAEIAEIIGDSGPEGEMVEPAPDGAEPGVSDEPAPGAVVPDTSPTDPNAPPDMTPDNRAPEPPSGTGAPQAQ